MAKEPNATCSICGKPYHVCASCRSTTTIKPWRTIADTIDCYKIYMIVYNYTRGNMTKSKAKEQIKNCNLPNTFLPHIKKVIDEILCNEKHIDKATKTDNVQINKTEEKNSANNE